MKADDQVLTGSQRWAGLATVVAMLGLLGFFLLHQSTNTGFFTPRFGSFEMLALYLPILVSFAAPIVRAIGGRQNPARPFQAAMSSTLALGSLWLVIIFPFNFARLADVLPSALQFVISWINDDMGRFILILQVLLGIIAAPLTIRKFFSERRQSALA